MIDQDQLQLARQALADTQDTINRLVEEIKTAERDIQTLRDLGTTDARPYWRNNKYLYLIHPQWQGKRDRDYIGSDPDKINAAMDRVKRHDSAQQLAHSQAANAAKLNRLISLALRLDPDSRPPYPQHPW